MAGVEGRGMLSGDFRVAKSGPGQPAVGLWSGELEAALCMVVGLRSVVEHYVLGFLIGAGRGVGWGPPYRRLGHGGVPAPLCPGRRCGLSYATRHIYLWVKTTPAPRFFFCWPPFFVVVSLVLKFCQGRRCGLSYMTIFCWPPFFVVVSLVLKFFGGAGVAFPT